MEEVFGEGGGDKEGAFGEWGRYGRGREEGVWTGFRENGRGVGKEYLGKRGGV